VSLNFKPMETVQTVEAWRCTEDLMRAMHEILRGLASVCDPLMRHCPCANPHLAAICRSGVRHTVVSSGDPTHEVL
jgi:hypothetical protein